MPSQVLLANWVRFMHSPYAQNVPCGCLRQAPRPSQPPALPEPVAAAIAVKDWLRASGRTSISRDALAARPGTWVHMPKGMRHAIQARTPVVMLLLLLKEARP